MAQPLTYIEQIKSRGYKEIPEIIIPTNDLINLSRSIDSINNSTIILPTKKKNYVLDKSRNFLDSHFQIQRVPYYNIKNYLFFQTERTGDIHPYGLPIIKKDYDEPFYGALREVINLKDGTIVSYYYSGIELNKKMNEISSLAYTHEIVHSQINHVPGLIQNYSNTEVLSIFLETLQAYETSEKLLRIHDSERLSELSGIITELEKYHSTTDESIKDILVEGSAYLESTLKAYKLFIRYINSSTNIQKEILKGIQKVFNQELSVEDFLISQDITLENSQEIHQLEKYLRR